MSNITRNEPDDLTAQDWLGEEQFFAADNLATDGNGHLVIDTQGIEALGDPAGAYHTEEESGLLLEARTAAYIGDTTIDSDGNHNDVLIELREWQGDTVLASKTVNLVDGLNTVHLGFNIESPGIYRVLRVNDEPLRRTDAGFNYSNEDYGFIHITSGFFEGSNFTDRAYYFFNLQITGTVGLRISNPLDVGAVNDVNASNIQWAATAPTNTSVEVKTLLNKSEWIGSLEFDGSDDVVAITPTSTLAETSDFTICTWVNLPGSSEDGIFLNSMPDSTSGTDWDNRWFFYPVTRVQSANNQIRLAHGVAGEIIIGPDIRGNGWVHLVLTREGNTFTLYVDNVQEAQNTASINLYWGRGFIGSLGGTERFLNGNLFDIRIYSEALSSSDRTDLYEGKEIDETNLVHHWKTDEGQGATLTDSAGDNDGTITGATWQGEDIPEEIWQDANNDDPIPVINENDDLTGKYLWVRQVLSTDDIGTTPVLESLTYSVSELAGLVAEYSATTLRKVTSSATYSSVTRRIVTKIAEYSAATLRILTAGASYTAATARSVLKVTSYSAGTLRAVTALASYSAGTLRAVQKIATYSAATLRQVADQIIASFSGATLRKVIKASPYSASTLRKAVSGASYSAATLRQVVTEIIASYSAATLRVVSKSTSYSARTLRKATELASYSARSSRIVKALASYSASTIRLISKVASFTASTFRKTTMVALYSPATVRIVKGLAVYAGASIRIVKSSASYSAATLRVVRDSVFVEFPAVLRTYVTISKFKTKTKIK